MAQNVALSCIFLKYMLLEDTPYRKCEKEIKIKHSEINYMLIEMKQKTIGNVIKESWRTTEKYL